MFAGGEGLGVGLGAVAAFVLGWLWYSPKMFYKSWTEAAGISHLPEYKMGAAFGSLVLILYVVFVGVMLAHGMIGPPPLAIGTFIEMAYSNSAFNKLGNVARRVEAGSWAASGVLMVVAQWLVGGGVPSHERFWFSGQDMTTRIVRVGQRL